VDTLDGGQGGTFFFSSTAPPSLPIPSPKPRNDYITVQLDSFGLVRCQSARMGVGKVGDTLGTAVGAYSYQKRLVWNWVIVGDKKQREQETERASTRNTWMRLHWNCKGCRRDFSFLRVLEEHGGSRTREIRRLEPNNGYAEVNYLRDCLIALGL
jgi:hypothetical protein